MSLTHAVQPCPEGHDELGVGLLGVLAVLAVGASTAAAATVTYVVADGWDSKQGKTLVQDGKLQQVQTSNNDWFQVEGGQSLVVRFAAAVPSSATVQSVRVVIERHEESQIAPGSIRWQAGGGTIQSPTAVLVRTPADRIGPGAEGTDEWELTSAIDTPAEVNGLTFGVRNTTTNGKKAYIDRIALIVVYDEQPPRGTAPVITSSPSTTGTVSQPYAYQPTATGTTPITWSLTTAPAGMTVDAATGRVSWTPTATGSYPVTLRAANSVGASTQSWTIAVSNAPPVPESATVLAAGDVADCGSSGDEQTANLLDANPQGTVLGLGDLAYESGTASEFANCDNPTWGRHKARTRPSPGNHEYQTSGASGDYGYFGAAAGPGNRGYYSFDLGAWHIVSLNSEVGTGTNSAQLNWLRADLAATSAQCVLAYFHRPRYTAGNYSDFTSMTAFWTALYNANADVVLGGHDHVYERYRPMTPAGASDPARGIRQFVVGTGGRGHYALRTDARREAGSTGTFGVLRLTLRATGYDFRFLPVAGGSYSDSGSANCH